MGSGTFGAGRWRAGLGASLKCSLFGRRTTMEAARRGRGGGGVAQAT